MLLTSPQLAPGDGFLATGLRRCPIGLTLVATTLFPGFPDSLAAHVDSRCFLRQLCFIKIPQSGHLVNANRELPVEGAALQLLPRCSPNAFVSSKRIRHRGHVTPTPMAR